MKALRIVVTGLLVAATLPPAHADDLLPTKQGVTFLGTTAAGVALGGPIGLLAGAAVGAWFSDNLQTAAAAEDNRLQLASTQAELKQLESELQHSRQDMIGLQQQLEVARDSSIQYAQLMLEQLELEMLFKTNAPQLTAAGQSRLQTLATFLMNNPDISVRLDGYADPRGTASYNLQLSVARVSHVAQALTELGVDPARVSNFSHGASQSSAREGDYDAYALERVVKINLAPNAATGLAHTN
jgi:outer membrane protein OmpA-like peptidoglycan-associated protein